MRVQYTLLVKMLINIKCLCGQSGRDKQTSDVNLENRTLFGILTPYLIFKTFPRRNFIQNDLNICIFPFEAIYQPQTFLLSQRIDIHMPWVRTTKETTLKADWRRSTRSKSSLRLSKQLVHTIGDISHQLSWQTTKRSCFVGIISIACLEK